MDIISSNAEFLGQLFCLDILYPVWMELEDSELSK